MHLKSGEEGEGRRGDAEDSEDCDLGIKEEGTDQTPWGLFRKGEMKQEDVVRGRETKTLMALMKMKMQTFPLHI